MTIAITRTKIAVIIVAVLGIAILRAQDAKPPQRPPVIEHKVLCDAFIEGSSKFNGPPEAMLNNWGSLGWRLVAVTPKEPARGGVSGWLGPCYYMTKP